MTGKQQFNVNLDPALIRRIKYAALDAQLSLSDLIAQVLATHLDQESAVSSPSYPLQLQPMVHVGSMPAAVAFFEALGATVCNGSRDGDFALLAMGESQLSLLAHPPNPEQNESQVELNFSAREPLEQIEARLRAAGVSIVAPTSDEGFGRQLQVATPDGLLVKINELEPDLYG